MSSTPSTLEACECSICYDAIDLKTTGEVKLSCAHSFHFSCISTWFSTQEKGSCPCCRKEMGDKEDFAPNAPADGEEDGEEDDEDEDEDEEDDMEDECVAFNRTQLISLCQKLGIYRHISEQQWEAMSAAFAVHDKEFATESWRLEFDFHQLKAFLAIHCSFTITYEQWINILVADETPMTGAFESARLDFAMPIDLPLQPFVRKDMTSFLEGQASASGGAASAAAAEAETLKVTWALLENGSWTRTVHNPEEEMAAILSPALTAAAAAATATEAATKVQAVWRGFSSRVRQVLPRLRVTSVWM